MPIPLIAIKQTYYDGPIAAGTRFSVRTTDEAHILKVLGRAKDAPPIHGSVSTPEDVPLVAAAAAVDETVSPRPKRTYRRRDLTAEPE